MEKNLPSAINSNTSRWKDEITVSLKKISLTCLVSAFVFLLGFMPGKSFGQDIRCTWTSVKASNLCEGSSSNLTLTATTADTVGADIPAGSSVTITFPTELDPTSITNGSTFQGFDISPTIYPSNNTVSFTVPTEISVGRGQTFVIILNGVTNKQPGHPQLSMTIGNSSGTQDVFDADPNSQVTINPAPSITPSATATAVCSSSNAQTSSLNYTTSGSPVSYSISWDDAAASENFVNVTDDNLTASPLSIAVPAGAATGTYTGTITVKNSGGCVSSPQTFTVTVNANKPVSVSIAASATTICAGTSVTFTATPTNGGSAPSYQWQVNGVNKGTDSPTFTTSTLADNDVVTVILTSNATPCATGSPATSNSITMNVNANKPVSVSIAASATTICAGTSVTFTATPTNGGSAPSYQWQVNGVNKGTDSPTFTTSTLADNDVVTVILTSNASPCATGSPATSNSITMNVNANKPVSVSISASATTICAGTSVTFTATPTNGGSAPSYQWQVNGVNKGTDSPTFTTSTLADNDVVTVILTSNASPCATGSPATSNSITMNVNANKPVSVSISASATTICAGTSVTFTATPTNGGSAPSYQWQVNGVNKGTDSPTFTTSTLADNDVVTVILTSNASPCATGSPATSNSITMNVNANKPVSVSISASATTICAGTSVTFTATPTNGGSAPSYQWQVNGVNQGTDSPTFTTSTLADNDVVTVVLTSNITPCATGNPATSNSITMNVNANKPVSVSIAASAITICAGTSVTFTATPTNGGSAPSYQWQVNGVNKGTDSPTFTTSTLADNDVVTVVLTSNITPCATGNPATSNSITETVNANKPVSVSIAASATTICAGTSVTFTATPTNGGSAPSYQWQVNGTNAGTNSASFTTTTLANNDVVTVVLTSNITPCATGNPATSNSITETVNANKPVSVSIAASATTICAGTSVTFTATPTNGGSAPAYQWKVNGINAGTNSASFTTTTLANNDVVTVVLTSNATPCATGNPATSNSITETVNANKPVSVSIAASATTICAGTSVTFTATPTNGGSAPSYQWQVNGTNAGTNSASFTTTTLANNDVVTVVLTSNITPCATGNPATSNSITETVNANKPVSVSIAASATTICAGTSVTFTATPTNGGSAPAYQWKVNGINAGTNSATFTTTTLANNDVVTVVLTSNVTPCATGNPATSNSITETVNANKPVSVSIAASATTICAGTSVTFTATPTNGGSAPAYQWKVNGINAGTNSATFTTTTLANNNVITVVLTSNATPCATGNPATSNSITETVNSVPAKFAVTGGGTICSGGTGASIGLSNTENKNINYQLQKDGVNVGNPVAGLNNGSGITFGPQTAAGTYTVIATNSSNCTSTMNGSATIVVNPAPNPPTGTGNSTCGTGTVTISATPGAGETIDWYAAATGGSVLVNGSGTTNYTTPSITTTTTYYAQARNTTTGCISPTRTAVIATVKTVPAAPTAGSNSPVCVGSTLNLTASTITGATYSWTGANSFTSTLQNPSISNATTATAGTYSVTATVNSCTSTAGNVSVTITTPPVATFSYTGSPYCQNATNPSPTFSNGGVAGTFSSTTGLVFVSTSTGQINLLASTPGDYTVQNTITSASCGTVTATSSVTITPTAVGGSVASNQTVCPGSAPANDLTLSGNTGSVVKWQRSTSPSFPSSSSTTDISNTSNTLSASDIGPLSVTTYYRAVVGSGDCGTVNSDYATITVNQPFTPTITASPTGAVCAGSPVTLTASGLNSIDSITGGTFSGGNPPGWSGASANNSNGANNSDWGEATGGKSYNSQVYSSNAPSGGKFMIVDGVTNEANHKDTLTSPSFSTIGMTSATLSWYQAFNFNSGTSGTVELSVDGGATYTTLVQYLGPLNMPVSQDFTKFTPQSFSLNNYLGKTNLKVRFTYVGTTGSNWAIDDVIIGGPQQPVNYSWSNGQTTQSIIVTPTTTTTYTLRDSIGGCSATTSSITISVNPLPTATINGTPASVCQNGTTPTVTFTGTNGTAPYTFTYNINGGASQTVTSGSGTNPQSATVTVPTGTAGTYIYNLVSVKGQFCSNPQTGSATITVNALPIQYTVTGGGSYCSGGTGVAIGLSNSQSGVNYQLLNGTTAVGSAVTGTGSAISFGNQTTAGTYTVVAANTTTGCTSTMTGSVPVTINPMPTTFNVTGGGSYCSGGSGVSIGLSGSETGTNYQLFNGANAVGSAIAGTGSTISFANQTAAGTYTVVGSNGNCSATMTGNATVTVNDPPAITTQPVSQNGCSTGNSTFSVTATGSSLTYQWQVSQDGGNSFSNITDGGVYSGATTNTLSISGATTAYSGYEYEVIVSGASSCSPVTSDIATLTEGNIWRGITSKDWDVSTNWACDIPLSGDDVFVPDTAKYMPRLMANTTVGSLTLQPNTSLTLNDKALTIRGTLIGTGKFSGSAASGLILNGTSSAYTLYFDQSNDSLTNVLDNLTIHSGAAVNLSNTLYIIGALIPNNSTLNAGGHLTLRSTSIANTARVAEVKGTINGDVTVERFIPARRAYRFVSPSTTGGTINSNWMEGGVNPDINTIVNPHPGYGTNITGRNPTINGLDATITTNPSLFTFNTLTQQWDSVPNSNGTLSAGSAYSLMVRGDRSIDMRTNTPTPTNTILRATGTLQTGTVMRSLSSTGKNFTFIGNPYASPVDFNKILSSSTNISSTYWAWDPEINTRGGYVLYNTTNNSNNLPDVSSVDKNIQSGQAVFVQTNNDGSASVQFQESFKSNDTNAYVFRAPFRLTKLSVQLLLNLNPGLQNTADGVVAFFDKKFASAIGKEDSYKFGNSDENLAIDHNGISLSMEGRPPVTVDDTIHLKMWQFRQTSYYLRLKATNFSPDVTAFVQDNYLHKQTPVDLLSVTDLPFSIDKNIPASFAKDRFMVVFRPATILPVTLTNVKAYQKDDGIQVDWSAEAETNIESYQVEKSADGQHFNNAATIPAKGNNSLTQNYGWYDENANVGSNFYRIKVIEKSGAVKYSNIVKVSIPEGAHRITVFPNPIKDNLIKVQFNNMEKGRYSVVLYNTLGQKLYSSTIDHTARSGTYLISLGRLISKGTYTLHISKGDMTENERVVVE